MALEKTMAAVAKAAGAKLADKSELAQLRQLQKEWDHGRQVTNAFSDQAVKAAWTQQRSDLADAIRRGEGTATGDAWSREDFLEEGQEKMEAGKDAMRAACQACLPLAETISERFLETATDLAKDIEAKELAEYQTFDVPYSASRLVLEIRRVGAMARSWVQQRKGSNFSNNSPQSLMPYLEL